MRYAAVVLLALAACRNAAAPDLRPCTLTKAFALADGRTETIRIHWNRCSDLDVETATQDGWTVTFD